MAHSVNKFKAIRTTVDGITFASKREAKYYADLKVLESNNKIRQLELQPRFKCVVDGRKICTYVADFAFRENDGQYRVWDVKGVETPVFKLKRKLVEALFPYVRIEVVK